MWPDRETDNAFVYCLAVAAERFGIRVLFTVAMSSHHHFSEDSKASDLHRNSRNTRTAAHVPHAARQR